MAGARVLLARSGLAEGVTPAIPQISRYAGSVAIALLCVVVGAVGTTLPSMALVMLGLAAILASQILRSRFLLTILVFATFITRFRVDVAGYHFLPEHLFVVALLVSLTLEGKGTELWRAATDRTSLALGVFIVWQALVSIAQSPHPSQSLAIVGWLCLDWGLLIAVLASCQGAPQLERLAVRSGVILAGIAVAIWFLYLTAGTTFGTQGGMDYGSSRAVYGLSWEANLLASTLAIWAFVGLTSPRQDVRRIVRIGGPLFLLAIVASFTRAVILGATGGLIAWILLRGRNVGERTGRMVSICVLAALIFVIALPFVVPIEGKLGNLIDIGSGSTGALRLDAADAALGDLHGGDLLVGLGANSFGQRHMDPTQPGTPWYLSILPMQILYDSGIVGVLLLGLALATLNPLRRIGRSVGVLMIYGSAATATSPFWLGTTWLLIALAIMTRPDDVAGRREFDDAERLPQHSERRACGSPPVSAAPTPGR